MPRESLAHLWFWLEGIRPRFLPFGESRQKLAGSPHVEALQAKGFEYLYLTDPIDQWAMDSLREFKEKKIVNAMSAELSIDESDEAKKKREEQAGELKPLLDKFQAVSTAGTQWNGNGNRNGSWTN